MMYSAVNQLVYILMFRMNLASISPVNHSVTLQGLSMINIGFCIVMGLSIYHQNGHYCSCKLILLIRVNRQMSAGQLVSRYVCYAVC